MEKRQAPGLSGTDRDRNRIKEIWSTLSLTGKIRYILSYYGIALALVLVLIFAIIFFAKDYQEKKSNNAFYVMAVECTTDETRVNAIQEELMEALQLDPEEESVLVETGYSSTANLQNEATISTYMQSGRVDLVIAPEEYFNTYAATGCLMTLEDAGILDLTEGLTDEELFYTVPVDYSTGGAVTEIPFAPHTVSEEAELYGIYLKGGIFDGYVIGVMYNAPHSEYIKKGISYFLSGESDCS